MKQTVMRRLFSITLAWILVFSAFPFCLNRAEAAAYTGCLSQRDPRWANYYVGGESIAATGCGILSLVNCVGYLTGEMMSVTAVADYAHSVGNFNYAGIYGVWRMEFYRRVEGKYGSTYGITVDCSSSNEGYWGDWDDAKLKNHLANGGVAIGHVPGHFIAIVGYNPDNGYFHIYESSESATRGTNYNGGDVWLSRTHLGRTSMTMDWYCLISATAKETWVEKACFDPMVYRDRNGDVAGISTMTDAELKAHWKSVGIKQGRASSPVLDLGFYANNNPDVKEAFTVNGVVDYEKIYNHFITSGYKEGRKSSALFDGAYYCEKYPEVASSYKDEYLRHYAETGIYEGRRASLTFHADYYWFIRPDVAAAWPGDYHMAARHYAGHGIIEQIEAYDHSHPVISDAVISDVSASGYTVTCTVTDNWGLSKVAFPTWTVLNDQDDLAADFMNTQQGTQNGNTYTFRVNASDHNNEGGGYVTHIYALDKGGNRVSLALDQVEVRDPFLGEITLVSGSRYTRSNDRILNVAAGTTVSNFLDAFENEVLEVVDCKGNVITGAAYVGTGTTVRLYDGAKLVDTVTVIILGDLDGNGIVSKADTDILKNVFLRKITLADYQTESADVDHNGMLNTTDYQRIRAHIMGMYDLHS